MRNSTVSSRRLPQRKTCSNATHTVSTTTPYSAKSTKLSAVSLRSAWTSRACVKWREGSELPLDTAMRRKMVTRREIGPRCVELAGWTFGSSTPKPRDQQRPIGRFTPTVVRWHAGYPFPRGSVNAQSLDAIARDSRAAPAPSPPQARICRPGPSCGAAGRVRGMLP